MKVKVEFVLDDSWSSYANENSPYLLEDLFKNINKDGIEEIKLLSIRADYD